MLAEMIPSELIAAVAFLVVFGFVLVVMTGRDHKRARRAWDLAIRA